MTTKTKTPDTAAHTREMLESILRPHSLEELYALVGSFPFKAVKVCKSPPGPGAEVYIVGQVYPVISRHEDGNFLERETETRIYTMDPHVKQWRLAE